MYSTHQHLLSLIVLFLIFILTLDGHIATTVLLFLPLHRILRITDRVNVVTVVKTMNKLSKIRQVKSESCM